VVTDTVFWLFLVTSFVTAFAEQFRCAFQLRVSANCSRLLAHGACPVAAKPDCRVSGSVGRDKLAANGVVRQMCRSQLAP